MQFQIFPLALRIRGSSICCSNHLAQFFFRRFFLHSFKSRLKFCFRETHTKYTRKQSIDSHDSEWQQLMDTILQRQITHTSGNNGMIDHPSRYGGFKNSSELGEKTTV